MDGRFSQVVQKTPYVAAGGTGFAAFTLNDWAVIVGIVITILTFVLNWIYKQKGLRAIRERLARGEKVREEDVDAIDKL
jgi:lipoprotein signal peptidase